MHIIHIVGARPNFIKAMPVIKALKKYENIKQTLIHTGQHYDWNMSEVFFKQLKMPEPDMNLGVGSGTHIHQVANIMLKLENILKSHKPDLAIVYGDVNSTLAGALACSMTGVKLAHVESGLRSFDRTMPEEINRMLTDHISDILFTTCEEANENLKREGIDDGKIYFVGNTMIDTLVMFIDTAKRLWKNGSLSLKGITVNEGEYALATLHRPSNVDNLHKLMEIMEALAEISEKIPIVFPVHPRTMGKIKELESNLKKIKKDNLYLIEPIGYVEFLAFEMKAKFVITDSGGIQEETTHLGVPCLTFRENTERPVTIRIGTNILVGSDPKKLVEEAFKILSGEVKRGKIPPLWDGKAGERISEIIFNLFLKQA